MRTIRYQSGREGSSCGLLRTWNEWSQDMWKALIAGTAAGVIAGSSLLFAQQPPTPATGVPTESERDRDHGWRPSAEDDQDNDWQPSAEDEQDSGWQPSAEDNQENGPHWRPSAEDVSAFMDARIAALKAGLRLTPDQEKNWPAFESAVRDTAKARSERWAMRQHEQPPAANPVERLQQHADALSNVRQGSKSSLMLRGHSIKV